jgi:hypothetical protein
MSLEHSTESSRVIDGGSHFRSFSPVRAAFLFFLFLNSVYLATSAGRVRSIDEIDPVLQSDSLLLRHSAAIPQAVHAGIWFGKYDVNGIPRSAWPVGHAILLLPWNAFGHSVFVRLPGMQTAMADLVITTAVCWGNATFSALAVSAFFLLCLKIAPQPRDALFCAAAMAFATPLFVYSGWLFSEPLSTALFLIAALLLFGSGKPPSTSRLLPATLMLAFSIHVRPANTLTVAVFILGLAVLEYSDGTTAIRYRTTAVLISVVMLSGVVYLIRNHVLFGNIFDFGVPPTAENGKDLESWHNPFWRGIFGFLFSPGKSVLLFSPPIILGILGIPRLWQRNRALCVIATLAPLSNLVLYSFRTQWEGSYCYGPRYLVPACALLMFPIAALFQDPPRFFRPMFWLTAITGFLVQVIGLSTNIMEDMVHNHYYGGNWDYRMGYSPITGQLRLIWKYLHQQPSVFGLGWDRWFLFLRSAGANSALVFGIESAFVACALVFGWLTWKVVWRANQSVSVDNEVGARVTAPRYA